MSLKRIFCLICGVILIYSVCFNSCAAESGYHWYLKYHSENGVCPSVEKKIDEVLACFDAHYVNKKANEKVIYLTFDAGYENGNVAKILDILKEENVTGAFFILSHLIKSAPALIQRMNDEGHLVCNHTATHKDQTKLSEDQVRAEIKAVAEAYEAKFDKKMAPYFRPPQGYFNEKSLKVTKEMGYKTIFWSLAYADWDDKIAPSDEKAKALLQKRTHNGAVILLHPTSDINVRILRDMIEYWKGEGYRFGTLNELTEE